MRSVLSRGRAVVAVCVLLVVLLAPSTYASDTATDPGLWDEFLTWVDTQAISADATVFLAWLMSRHTVPGG